MALTKCKECGTEVSTKAKVCTKCGAPVRKKTSLLTWLVAIIVLGVVVSRVASGPSTGPSTASAPKAVPTPRDEALANTKLDFTVSKVGFGNVMEANFTVHNKSKYTIKDLRIKCMHSANSGTALGTSTQTIYDVIKANSTRQFPKVNMGFINTQATSSSCYIADLVVMN